MLLSVCIVTRDKAPSISRTIKSVKEIADEVILVDLDSLDNTRKIAREAGARVFHLKGRVNLNMGRNIAREKVRGCWVLFLDGDEELGEDYHQLRLILRYSDEDGFYLPVIDLKRNPYTGKNFLLPRLSFRLYRNKKEYFYSNNRHESITNSILAIKGEASLKILHLPIVRRASSLLFSESILLNLSLYEKEVLSDRILADGEMAATVKKALEEANEANYELAIARLEEACELVGEKERIAILESLVSLLLEDRQYLRAERVIRMGLAEDPENVVFKFWEGYLGFLGGRYEQALDSFQEIILGDLRNNKIGRGFLAHAYLFSGLILFFRKQKEAVLYLEKAFSFDRENRIIISALLELIELNPDNLFNYFQLDEPENKDLLLLILEALFLKKEYYLIEEIINRQKIIRENENILLYWQGLIFLKNKQYNLSRKKLREITPDFIYYRQALHLQWLLNLLIPGKAESRSAANQVKLMGDYLDWHLVNYIKRIYFYREKILISFDNAVTGLKFYTRLLYFLDLFCEFTFREGISILLEIIKNLRMPGKDSNLGILFYYHDYREEAFKYLQTALKQGPSLLEVNLMRELHSKTGKYTEEREWSEKSEYPILPGEIILFCRNSSLFVE